MLGKHALFDFNRRVIKGDSRAASDLCDTLERLLNAQSLSVEHFLGPTIARSLRRLRAPIKTDQNEASKKNTPPNHKNICELAEAIWVGVQSPPANETERTRQFWKSFKEYLKSKAPGRAIRIDCLDSLKEALYEIVGLA